MASEAADAATDGARLDLRLYRVSAIKKAAYRLAKRLTVILGELDGDSLAVRFEFPPAATENARREAVRLFYQELLDQELREAVAAETQPLRALILAQAFSKISLLEP